MADFNRNRGFSKGRGGGKSSFRRRSRESSGSSLDNGTHFSRNTRRFGPRESGSKLEFHKTTCAKCGERCEVPFKPNNRKPVYCSDCFRKQDSPDFDREDSQRPQERSSSGSNELRQINEKLDRILQLLEE